MKSRLPPNWPQIRRAVLDRDDGDCQIRLPECSVVATEVDHITPRARGGGHELDNLRAVCRNCHKARQKGRGGKRLLAMSRAW